MKKDYDFSKGKRGLFYRPGVELNIPIYLDPVGAIVNEWLRKELKAKAK